MKFNIATILKILIEFTYDEVNKTDCVDEMSVALGLSTESNRIRHAIHQKDMRFDTAYKMLEYLGYDIGILNNGIYTTFKNSKDGLHFLQVELIKQKLTKKELAERLNISYRGLMGYFTQTNLEIGTLTKLFNGIGHNLIIYSKSNPKKSYVLGNNDYWDYILNEQDSEINLREELNMESIEQFFRSKAIDIDIKGKISADALYVAYSKWCSQNGFHPLEFIKFIQHSRSKAGFFKNEFYGIKVCEVQ